MLCKLYLNKDIMRGGGAERGREYFFIYLNSKEVVLPQANVLKDTVKTLMIYLETSNLLN